jgi:hypothetical protein
LGMSWARALEENITDRTAIEAFTVMEVINLGMV